MTDAPFGRRLAARVLDLLFALPLTFLMAVPVVIVFIPALIVIDEGTRAYDAMITIAASLAYFIAYVALEWFLLIRRNGQTLGKGLMGLRVVSTDEQPLRLGSAFLRLFVLLLPFPLFSMAGSDDTSAFWNTVAVIGFFALVMSLVLAVLRRNHRKALHDMAAHSRVVVAPKRGINLRMDLPMMVPRRVSLEKSL